MVAPWLPIARALGEALLEALPDVVGERCGAGLYRGGRALSTEMPLSSFDKRIGSKGSN